jgi:hypothetical protein
MRHAPLLHGSLYHYKKDIFVQTEIFLSPLAPNSAQSLLCACPVQVGQRKERKTTQNKPASLFQLHFMYFRKHLWGDLHAVLAHAHGLSKGFPNFGLKIDKNVSIKP